MKTLQAFVSAVLAPFDLRDAMFGAGLGLLAYGLWYVSAGLALGVPGAILIYVAIFIRPDANANRVDETEA